MRIFSLVYILLSIGLSVFSQSSVKKETNSEGTIFFQGMDAWVSHKFYVNIYISTHSAKIVVAYQDSVRISSLKNDPKYILLRVEQEKFGLDEGKPRWFTDSVAKVIKKHYVYTKDSISLDLVKDRKYDNLLKRFLNAPKDDIVPKIEGNLLDGYSIATIIITTDKRLTLNADTPRSSTHPLLIEMLSSTLDKFKESDAVNKIRGYYIW